MAQDLEVITGYLKDEETGKVFLPRTDASLVAGAVKDTDVVEFTTAELEEIWEDA